MIEFRPFKAGHLSFFTPQPEQRNEHAMLVASGVGAALEQGIALSAWRGTSCIGAAGLIQVWPHKAVAWMFLSDQIGSAMLPIVRKVRRTIAAAPYRRVELTVSDRFDKGHDFARLLGAERETPEPMRFYGADGGGEVMYAVVKED